MKRIIIATILLTITALSALADPNYTSGPWGIDAGGFKNLSTALSSPSTVGKTVIVSRPMAINNKVTERSINVTLGGKIDIAGGTTFTINGPFHSEAHDVFLGSGKVAFPTNVVPVNYENWTGNRYITATTQQAPAISTGFGYALEQKLLTTKAGVNVQSGTAVEVITRSYSTNSGGIATDNKTNQAAIVANASAMDAQSSASVVALNAISQSNYTGLGTQTVNPLQSNIGTTNPPGFFGEGGKAHGVAISAINVGNTDATMGLLVDTATIGKGFLHGAIISGVTKTGITIARNTLTPDTGIWVSAAKTYGLYVGPKFLYQLEPGQTPTYDADHNPAIGIALGKQSQITGNSNILRFESSSPGGEELHYDIYTDTEGSLHIDANGVNRILISAVGTIYVQGTQVVGPRRTGWSQATGILSRTSFDTERATTAQIARVLASLIQDLTAHGLIGQ